jgi:hypothetical protein
MRRFVLAAAALLLGLVVAAILSEVVVRLAHLDDFDLEFYLGADMPPLFRFDDRLGWTNLPSRYGTNPQGFRHPRVYQARKTLPARIAILGDSQVYGFSVRQREHLGVVLDERLEDVEVYSFGVPGYGPAQELLLLEDILREYEPDAVIVVPFLDNDPVDATLVMAYGQFQKPYLERDSGERESEGWRVTNVPVPRPVLLEPDRPLAFYSSSREALFLRPRQDLYRASAVYRALARRSTVVPEMARWLSALGLAELFSVSATAWEAGGWSARRVDGRVIPCLLLGACPEEHWLDGLPAMRAAYRAMARLSEQSGAEFRVLLAPSSAELERDDFRVTNALAAALDDEAIRVIDLRESVSSPEQWSELVEPFPDSHWTPAGHQRAAQAIERDWRASIASPGDSASD